MNDLTSFPVATPLSHPQAQAVGSLVTAGPRNPRDGFGVMTLGPWSPVQHDTTGVTSVVEARPRLSIHNYMNSLGATPVEAGRRVYAAKQAAPPRGHYR